VLGFQAENTLDAHGWLRGIGFHAFSLSRYSTNYMIPFPTATAGILSRCILLVSHILVNSLGYGNDETKGGALVLFIMDLLDKSIYIYSLYG